MFSNDTDAQRINLYGLEQRNVGLLRAENEDQITHKVTSRLKKGAKFLNLKATHDQMYLGEQRMIVGHGCLDKERESFERSKRNRTRERH